MPATVSHVASSPLQDIVRMNETTRFFADIGPATRSILSNSGASAKALLPGRRRSAYKRLGCSTLREAWPYLVHSLKDAVEGAIDQWVYSPQSLVEVPSVEGGGREVMTRAAKSRNRSAREICSAASASVSPGPVP